MWHIQEKFRKECVIEQLNLFRNFSIIYFMERSSSKLIAKFSEWFDTFGAIRLFMSAWLKSVFRYSSNSKQIFNTIIVVTN